MGLCLPLADGPVVVGRDDNCDFRLNDPCVSRRHVCLLPDRGGYYAVDLESTNGTYVNDQRAARSRLEDGDYLRIGNRIFRYLAGGRVQA
jgi:pSer/pThr/pTyr-binding forkhead associated (FHA) protein